MKIYGILEGFLAFGSMFGDARDWIEFLWVRLLEVRVWWEMGIEFGFLKGLVFWEGSYGGKGC